MSEPPDAAPMRRPAELVVGRAGLTRDGLSADLELDARGNMEGLELRQFVAATPGGSMRAGGTLAWSPALSWDLEATLEELAMAIHPHPTSSEIVMEAAHVALGQAIHVFKRQ